MRAAYLLSRALEPLQVDRSGMTGHFVEVYPAAAFVQWGIKTNRNVKRHLLLRSWETPTFTHPRL